MAEVLVEHPLDATAQTDLATNLDDQKTATEVRAEEKAAYDENIKNLVAAQGLLGEAIKVLDAFYSRSDLKVILIAKSKVLS